MEANMKQLSLIPRQNLSCGGSLNNTKQTKRVLSSRRPIHLVLKSKSSVNLFRSRLKIKHLAAQYADRFGVKIYASSVQRDHLHLVIKTASRTAYIKFIRTLTGMLAKHLGKGVWQVRPFTRVASWGKDFRDLLDYLFRNDMEVFKIWNYQARHFRTRNKQAQPKISIQYLLTEQTI